jgi:signal transduction histidine kinase
MLLSGILILLYYAWVAMDFMTNPNARRDFLGSFFQFSSVVMLWGLVYLGAKLFDYRKKKEEEEKKKLALVQEYERRMMQLELLDEIADLVNDAVNNPLAVISLSVSSIRERFEPDSEILAYLDGIEGALHRVREVLAGYKSYQSSRIVSSIKGVPSKSVHSTQASEQKALSVDPSGDIRSS